MKLQPEKSSDQKSTTTEPVQKHSGPRQSQLQLQALGYEAAAQALSPRSEAVQAAAEQGVAGNGGAMPHIAQIQEAFGRHDISNVQAHVGGSTADACESMGAHAYASRGSVAFKSAPDVRLAAHEAAHVVQQRAGVSLSGGVGSVGDSYEVHADQVADLVVQGKSAEGLLDQYGPGGTGQNSAPVQQKAVQMYAEVSGQVYDRLSDDGKMATNDHGKEGWAEKANIQSSNTILKAQKSKAQIKETGGSIKVAPPGNPTGAPRELTKFSMVESATPSSELSLRDDCGGANQQILGSEAEGYRSFTAGFKVGSTTNWTKNPARYQGDDNSRGGIVSTTEKISGQIYIRIMKLEFNKTLTRKDALKKWDKLSATKKDMLERKYGLNEHAVPQPGQGITIGSERDMPGTTSGGYNFHFGYNLMASGHDYMTLEDYASSGRMYYLDMYGPASKGQSWAQEPDNTDALGPKTTTMVVTHPENLKGAAARATPLLHPSDHKELGTLKAGDKVEITRQGSYWVHVEIKSGSLAGRRGWMRRSAYNDT